VGGGNASRHVPFAGPPIVSGYTKPLILLPSESVWVSLSRTTGKKDDRKGRRGNKKARNEGWRRGGGGEGGARVEGGGKRGEGQEVPGILEREGLRAALDSRMLLDYAGIRNFLLGSLPSSHRGNRPRNRCCPTTQSRRAPCRLLDFSSSRRRFLFPLRLLLLLLLLLLLVEHPRARRNVFVLCALDPEAGPALLV